MVHCNIQDNYVFASSLWLWMINKDGADTAFNSNERQRTGAIHTMFYMIPFNATMIYEFTADKMIPIVYHTVPMEIRLDSPIEHG